MKNIELNLTKGDMSRKHGHYFRSVEHLSEIDIYRLLDLFNVTDQALGHAIKKLVAPGGRGAGKDFRKDIEEAIDTLHRRLEMLDEDDLHAEAQHAATAPIVDPKDPEYAPDSIAFGSNADACNWIYWHGGDCPVAENTEVEYRIRSGLQSENSAGNLLWGHEYGPLDLIAYRVL